MEAIWAATSVCLLCLVGCAPPVHAGGKAAPAPRAAMPQRAPVYHLAQIAVADSAPARHVWVVENEKGTLLPEGQGAVYESLDSPALRRWVGRLPEGSRITTVVGMGLNGVSPAAAERPAVTAPDRWGGQELQGFAGFCRSRGVRFEIVAVSA